MKTTIRKSSDQLHMYLGRLAGECTGQRSGADHRRRVRRRLERPEGLECRRLLDMAAGQIVADWNAGIAGVKQNTSALISAWNRDLADVPIVRDQPAQFLKLDQQIKQSLPASLSTSTQTLGSLAAALASARLKVFYLGTTPDAAGNYLEARETISARNVNVTQVAVGGSQGFAYLSQPVSSLSGSLSGRLNNLTGTLTFVINDAGLSIRAADSSLQAQFQVSGRVSGQEDIGYLHHVLVDGQATISGTLGLKFRSDLSSLIQPDQFGNDRLVNGTLAGNVSYAPTFKASLGSVARIGWTGSFTAQLSNKSLHTSQSLVAPSYQSVVNQLGAGRIADLKSFSWFAEIENDLDKKLPLIGKSLDDMLGIESKVGSGLAVLGISVLNPTQGKAAMQSLITGQNVNLVRYDHNGSISLWNGNIIPEFPLFDIELLPGILSGELDAYLKAGLSLSYQIHVGVDTQGFYLDPASNIGISGSIEGGIEGKISVAGFDLASATGGLALKTTLDVGLSDPNKDGKIHESEFAGGASRVLTTNVNVDLTGEVKAKLNLLVTKVTVYSKSFEIANLINDTFGPGGAPVGVIKPLAFDSTDTLASDPDRLPPPAAPTQLHAGLLTSSTADLSWADNSDTEADFRVQASTNGQSWYDVGTAPANATAFEVSNLQPATSYEFRVRAEHALGQSPYSNVAAVTTLDVPPAAPGSLRAANVWSGTIDLNWDDHSSNETAFRVAISRDGGANWDNVGTVGANVTSFRVTGLDPATSYLFKVRAANTAGYSDYSNTISVTTLDVPPAAPGNLRAANVWSGTIDLNWDDRSGNETGFVIYMSTNGTHFDAVGSTNTNAVAFRVTNLRPSTHYWFRVVAVNAIGTSLASNTIDLRTRS